MPFNRHSNRCEKSLCERLDADKNLPCTKLVIPCLVSGIYLLRQESLSSFLFCNVMKWNVPQLGKMTSFAVGHNVGIYYNSR